MVNIRVYDIARRAYTYEDGLAVFNVIANSFEENIPVSLSFERIESIPSSFANGCFVKLLEMYGLDKIKSSLTIEKSTRQINKMIKDRLVFEAKRMDT